MIHNLNSKWQGVYRGRLSLLWVFVLIAVLLIGLSAGARELSPFENRAFSELEKDYRRAQAKCTDDNCRQHYADLLATLLAIKEAGGVQ